ncbi:unnamed protein product [Trichobilharzia szidati]|nr:unnamed protein product [Trichobilharzia szidati]
MAEVVERNLEDSVGEILHIRKAKLFNKLEINEIVRKRRHHEYTLQKRNKRIIDYDAYISTEMTILKLLRFRRQTADDTRYVDKIEKSIISRLMRLHRQLCYRFQSHIDLWMRFIHFCKTIGRHLSVMRIWNNMLRIHGRTEPRLWIAAAAYHLHHGVRAEARGELQNISKQKNELLKVRKRLRNEYTVMTTCTSKEQKQRLSDLIEELKENENSLTEATKDMSREHRLTWDRAHLNAIREARHLLTEGISLNPECDLLHLELVKLEINAMDFFRTRVLPRYEGCGDNNNDNRNNDNGIINMSLDNSLTDESNHTIKKKKKKMELKPLTKKEEYDNREFMSLVTEDVKFIVEGGAVNLVIESLLTRWVNNSKMLESLEQVLSTVPHLIDSALFKKISKCINDAKEAENSQSMQKDEVSPESQAQRMQSILSGQLVEIHKAMMEKGVEGVLHLWNSWYLPSTNSNSSNIVSSFRLINPAFPEAIGLLKARLTALSLYSVHELDDQLLTSPKETINSMDVDRDDNNDNNNIDSHTAYHSRRQYLSSEVNKTRSLFNLLATSQWGTHCPEFWQLYLKFESEIGDITQVPAIHWRAQKTLVKEQFDKFIKLLNN